MKGERNERRIKMEPVGGFEPAIPWVEAKYSTFESHRLDGADGEG